MVRLGYSRETLLSVFSEASEIFYETPNHDVHISTPGGVLRAHRQRWWNEKLRVEREVEGGMRSWGWNEKRGALNRS